MVGHAVARRFLVGCNNAMRLTPCLLYSEVALVLITSYENYFRLNVERSDDGVEG